jgi:uncharacterized membrane protein
MLHVTKNITINQPPEVVYQFWRDFSNLSRFMIHVQSIVTTADRRSHWTVSAPAGATVEWDAEIVEDVPGHRIAWRTLESSNIRHEGSVRFDQAPADRGTEVRVELQYDAPGGGAGAAMASLLGEEPTQQIGDDLRRFKQVMETGEVVRSEGSPDGAGEGASNEHPAQPRRVEVQR